MNILLDPKIKLTMPQWLRLSRAIEQAPPGDQQRLLHGFENAVLTAMAKGGPDPMAAGQAAGMGYLEQHITKAAGTPPRSAVLGIF